MQKKNIIFLILIIGCIQPFSVSPKTNRIIFFLQNLFKIKSGQVGSVTPSSNQTGKAMSYYVANHNGGPKNILEVGAGPGSGITEDIVANMEPQDRLTLVEVNPEFVTILHEKYDHHANISIVQADILTFNPDQKFDYIISTLPLTIFPKAFISQYFEHIQELSQPKGIVSYIQYIGFPRIRMFIDAILRKTALKEKMQLIEHFKSKWLLESKKVLFNFPPTWVHHLQMA
ncbi:methyltransferase domain-containing protein [bacterium]|jgi:phospholipid N-methyltransferase|nr:methyltransferase domain-containing protein [bacterium]MBT5015834.1 methyltransferase domain-containing protein [bacterium]